MMPLPTMMDAVERSNLFGREDFSPFDLHFCLLVHELKLEAVQLLLLCEKRRLQGSAQKCKI